MNEKSDTIICSDCGALIDSSLDNSEFRASCTICGRNRRTYSASITESVIARDGIGVKAKRAGAKRPFVEDTSRPDFSRSLKKSVHLERVIDRDNDRYFEKVTDYETGEVVHHCEEPLSKHRGHGTDKKNAQKAHANKKH